jgi:hypothetical protein
LSQKVLLHTQYFSEWSFVDWPVRQGDCLSSFSLVSGPSVGKFARDSVRTSGHRSGSKSASSMFYFTCTSDTFCIIFPFLRCKATKQFFPYQHRCFVSCFGDLSVCVPV